MKRIFLYLLTALMATDAMAQGSELSERFNPEIYGVTSLAIAPDARAGAMGDMGCISSHPILIVGLLLISSCSAATYL